MSGALAWLAEAGPVPACLALAWLGLAAFAGLVALRLRAVTRRLEGRVEHRAGALAQPDSPPDLRARRLRARRARALTGLLIVTGVPILGFLTLNHGPVWGLIGLGLGMLALGLPNLRLAERLLAGRPRR